MVVGVRDGVDYDDSKRNQADFALWFTKSKFEDQDLKWDSPLELVIQDGILSVLVLV